MRIVATIEARMGSSRRPGKVLLPANGKPMLAHLIDRLRRVGSIQQIVLATTTQPADEPLVDFALRAGVGCVRGSETDVMQRVIDAADSARAEAVVEITGDCPIIDPAIVEETIQTFLRQGCDYATNAHVRSFPDGMDTQVFRLEALKRSAAMTTDPLDREHVTLHIRRHPERFSHAYVIAPPELHWPELRLTLDEAKDYELLLRLIEHFGDANPYFSCGDVIRALRERPDWIVNRDVRSKGDT